MPMLQSCSSFLQYIAHLQVPGVEYNIIYKAIAAGWQADIFSVSSTLSNHLLHVIVGSAVLENGRGQEEKDSSSTQALWYSLHFCLTEVFFFLIHVFMY